MTCKCKKQLVERTVATKTRKIGTDTIVETSRKALVCEVCGVVAWDPPQPAPFSPNQSRPWHPLVGQPLGVNPYAYPNGTIARPSITYFNPTAGAASAPSV